MSHCWPLIFLTLLGAVLAGDAAAQDRNWDGWDLIADPSFYRNPDREVIRVFRLPEAPEAERLIEKARASIAEQDYGAAVEALSSVVAEADGRVFQVGRESVRGSKSCARFVGAPEFAHYLLSRLPPAGREAYDELIGDRVRDELARAKRDRDWRALERIAAAYATASAGKEALRCLADYHLERGEADLAVMLLKRCLLHAGRPEEEVVLRLVRALDEAGEEDRESAYLALLDAGRQKDNALAADLENNPPVSAPAPSDWPTVGGGAGRNRPMPLYDGAGFAIPKWTREVFTESLADHNPFAGGSVQPVPFHLARSGEVLFVNDSVSVRAFSAYTGELLWHHAGPLEEKAGGDDTFDLADYVDQSYSRQAGTISRHIVAGATVSNGALLVNLQVERPRRQKKLLYRHVINKPIPVRHLFALSMRDGRILWDQTGGDPNPESLMNRLSIASPPVAAGNRVFVNGHLIEGGVRSFVLCFDLETGELIWKTPVGVGQQQLTMFNMNFQEFAETPLTLDDGTLYLCSNLGYVAAVDAYSGRPLWVTEYEAIPLPQESHYTNPTPRPVFWHNTPPLTSGTTVVATPLDSEYAVAFDRFTGKMKWVFPATRLCRTNCRYMMGIRADRLIVGSAGGAAALDLESGSMAWRTTALMEGEPCLGRGALAEDALYLSLGNRIVAVETLSGRIVKEQDAGEHVDGGQNLFLFGDVTARVTTEALRVSFDAAGMLQDALSRLGAASAPAAEAAAGVEKVFADLLFIGDMCRLEGELDRAESFYRQALEAAAAAGRAPDSADLRRIRSGLFSVHFDKGTAALHGEDPRLAEKEFRAAVETAPSGADAVRAAVELVELFRSENDDASLDELLDEIERLYEGVMYDFAGRFDFGRCRAGFFAAVQRCRAAEARGDPARTLAALRAVLDRYPDETFNASPPAAKAGEWAAAKIGLIIREHGRAVYAPYEAAAEKAYEEGVSAKNADLLASVAARFPNAEVAAPAVLDRSRLLLDSGRPAEAYASLAALAGGETHPEALPHALFLMAKAAEREGNPDLARALYDRVRNRFSFVPSPWDEGATYRDVLPEAAAEASRAAAVPALPRPPFAESETVLNSGVAELLQVAGSGGGGLDTRVLVRVAAPERLLLYDFVKAEIVWEQRIDPAGIADSSRFGDPRRAVLTGSIAAVCYDRAVFGVDVETGRVEWELPFAGWVMDVDVAPGAFKIIHAVYDEDSESTVTAELISSVSGMRLWTRNLSGLSDLLQIVPSEDAFAVLMDRQELLMLDALTGAPLRQVTLDCIAADPLPFAPPPGRLLFSALKGGMRQNYILAVDSTTGEEAWDFPMGRRAIHHGRVLSCPEGLLAAGGDDEGGGYDQQLHYLDGATGKILKSFHLAPPDTLFTGDSVLRGDVVFIRPLRAGQSLPVSGLSLSAGSWRFEDVPLDLVSQGGRHPVVQAGIYAADGIVIPVDYDPARRDDLAQCGRLFFLDGATGAVTLQRDVLLPERAFRLGRFRSDLQAVLRENAVIVLCGDRLICIRGER